MPTARVALSGPQDVARQTPDRLRDLPASLPLGAHVLADGTTSFLVWAPALEYVRLRIHAARPFTVELEPLPHGYWGTVLGDVPAGTRYTFVLPDGRNVPDPATRFQPDGVHGASQVVGTGFEWRTASWQAPELRTMVLYELHVGTFTPEGTLDAAIPRLPALRDLGITAVELMPLAQFSGTRNWGYDGVFAFAVQNSYGGPAALKRFVDAAHALDLHVVLDVVYNHVGPEGNYLPTFGHYFTGTYHTPWGAAINVDDSGSDEVRRYFTDSALQWIDEFRIDGLRVDAVHAIFDRSASPFLRELTDAVHARATALGRNAIVIAESDLGDPRVIRPEHLGGLGFDAQWLDDFHHSLRTLLTHEDRGYYVDFGTLAHFARACRTGYVYTGEHSRFRNRRHGAPGPDILPRQFVVYSQNHDQVGNRMRGDRPAGTVTPAQLRLAAAAVLLSPFTPMLFMGEEYGTRKPFPYFVSHGDPALLAAVRRGRLEEFAAFTWEGEPPDPAAESTFRSAVLDWGERESGAHGAMLRLYRRLLGLRRDEAAIAAADAMKTDILDTAGAPSDGAMPDGVITMHRRSAGQSTLLFLNFADRSARLDVPAIEDGWRAALDTESAEFGGAGSDLPERVAAGATIELRPHSAVLLLHDET
ncbi:MAG TPA: malto-oligosyltrehalose trehalohydrolase [Longimicrobiales bacterium]